MGFSVVKQAVNPGAAPCPICGKPASPETKPFCSSRCADIDLGRWLGERYVIPGPEHEELPRPPRSDDGDHSL
ncbi:DNA gyrase inhibitor YacG [Methylorubrum rhodesianum]|uniref:DNA gyrase inhibitor YacG n=1 Tax=Methylorubrum rhodesianum TaxID=29427 RepID=A0ABU9ZEB2_9HYPH|nr:MULTISPECIES: DNA gyrase inhibitor YacG [Methylorubrum]MBI1688113.1 DNA gyrase inhibitor YacG [Methylorubrum sp. DB1722]MBK3406317.1 DNA gyrase inhibitor YacG [Methylorubrum rhodesianum]MBY0143189.1 DNA gyrase inhibitor YacG [Methylorubrum populi]